MLSLGHRSDVFDAEMMGLAIAAKRVATMVNSPSHGTPVCHVLFASDNLAAVQMISDLSPHTAQAASIIFRNCIDSLLRSHPELSITVQWVKGHANIAGNERADTLALKASSLTPTPIFNRTISWAKARAKTRAVRTWRHKWDSEPHSDHVRVSLNRPPAWKLHAYHQSINIDRGRHCRLIQIILGHGFFGEYYARFNLTEDAQNMAECQCNHQTRQKIAHVIRECPLHDIYRSLILRRASKPVLLADLFGSVKGLTALSRFIHLSHCFRKVTYNDDSAI